MYPLARKSGIPQSTLSNLFLRCNSPSVPTPEKICDALGISLARFFGGTDATLSDDENHLLREWNRLTPDARQALLNSLATLG